MMSNRNLLILFVVMSVMMAATALLYSREAKRESDFEPGMLIIQGLDPELIHTIEIGKGDTATTLQRDEQKGFALLERDGYPAEIEEVNELIIDCLDMRAAHKMTTDPEKHEPLGVAEDSDGATVARFRKEDDSVLLGFVLSKTGEQGFPYVRLLGEDTVYQLQQVLYLIPDPMSYVDKQLITMKRNDIASMELMPAEGEQVTILNEDADIRLQSVPEGRRAKQSDVEASFTALCSFSFRDVRPADEVKPEWDSTAVCTLKTGLVYRVEMTEEDDVILARFTATPPNIEDLKWSGRETDEDLKENEDLLLAIDTAEEFNARHAPWVYEISRYRADQLRSTLDELTEEIPEGPPDQIAARHILISYSGAERADTDRTKEDARKLAEEVREKALAEEADFAELANEHSDDPNTVNGDLGTFRRGVMDPAFEAAAFNLEVGEISDVVETPFGFHIIKRTE